MAAASGTEDFALVRQPGLEERLFAEPYCFEFVQAVRLLRRFYPHRKEVGLFQPPRTEAVRFGATPSLAFPASEIQELVERPSAPPLMRVNFMGLIGPLGVLPLYYTELVADRVRGRDHTLLDFLDIFHHRLISLFYRVSRKYHFQIGYEQHEEDSFSECLLHLIGLGSAALRTRQPVMDESLLFYTGLIAQQPHSAEALRLLLASYFDVPVTVEQFLGAWYRIEPSTQCRLDDTTLESQQLGFGAIVGDEVWDPQSRIRIVIGPLALERYLDFLPTGSAFQPLQSIVRFFAGDEFDFELQLILKRESVPPCRLGEAGSNAPRLGWLTWCKTRELEYNPSETILQL
jgi:type VI secretion system protein ImpH